MEIVRSNNSEIINKILHRGNLDYTKEERSVKNIIKLVKENGDRALVEFTSKFDKVNIEPKKIRIDKKELNKAANRCDKSLQKAINNAVKNVYRFHKKQIVRGYEIRNKNIYLGQKVVPVKNVGIYIPGGASPLFSTIIMTAVPAIIAGVNRIVAVTPPSKEGIFPAMAYTFKHLGITEIYNIGGAQAIAALAFGTKSIKKVDKIVGPGNIYVSLAKKNLYGQIDIDMIAGPSEILIIADKNADPRLVACDLLSQAEHGSGLESSVLLTNSLKLAKDVNNEIEVLIGPYPDHAPLKRALNNYGMIAVLKDLDKCVDLANKIAPEHLELMVKYPEKLVNKIENAGAVFMGYYSCESLGDYFAGPNHVLPTNSTSRFYSALGVYSFLKRISIIQYNKEGLKRDASQIINMAESEGLYFHANSIRERLK